MRQESIEKNIKEKIRLCNGQFLRRKRGKKTYREQSKLTGYSMSTLDRREGGFTDIVILIESCENKVEFLNHVSKLYELKTLKNSN